jgi:hypothetical protein
MDHYSDSATAITAVLSTYFKGIFNGDAELLRGIFHPQALVSGDVNGQPYFKSLDQYLEGVKGRKSPFEMKETFRMDILSIEIINAIAVARVRVPIFDFHYHDLLSLTKINGAWVIVNKLLTNVNI